MKLYLSVFSCCISFYTHAQTADTYWKNWNKNYPKHDIPAMLRFEQKYADSVEKHPDISPNYFRRASYRFTATFLSKVSPVDTATMASMRRVLKFTGEGPIPITNLVDSAVLMKVGTTQVWMPIQKQLLQQLRDEVSHNGKVTLYCLYLNEHTGENKLFNNFVISEFIAGANKD